jgi:hypothetical protein
VGWFLFACRDGYDGKKEEAVVMVVPWWNQHAGSCVYRPALGAAGIWESSMNKVIERVMQTIGLMKTMDEEETEQTREVLLDFLSKRPGTDERAAAVEGVRFLRNLKT